MESTQALLVEWLKSMTDSSIDVGSSPTGSDGENSVLARLGQISFTGSVRLRALSVHGLPSPD